ncbi:MAG: hypothetical protein KTR20_11485 [Cellvibrionaceae bacterium]|nr:hypothetical protein [Cellvibrionaceae bacterium]
MTRHLLIILIGIAVASPCLCKPRNTEETTLSNPVTLKKFADVNFTGIEKNNFIFEESENILLLKRKSYEGIDSLKITIKNHFEPIKAEVHYGALQYTIDDNPAFPLHTSFQENIILNKDNNNNYDLSKILKTKNEIEALIINKYYDLFLNESLKTQKEFWKKIAIDKNLAECCQEYIDKAKKNLARQKHHFKSFHDLSLEPIYKKIVLTIEKNRKIVFINYQ